MHVLHKFFGFNITQQLGRTRTHNHLNISPFLKQLDQGSTYFMYLSNYSTQFLSALRQDQCDLMLGSKVVHFYLKLPKQFLLNK